MKRMLGIVALTLISVAPAFAQIGQGRLTGTVTDAQGAVLPGVTVTAASSSLIGTQTSVTEADGKYRFPSLPSGTYSVTFELSGFQKLVRENIRVVFGQTISADIQLQLATLAETVTVTGESPVVDVTTTKVGSNLKSDVLAAVPASTDVWGALSSSPGIRMQSFDVGGSHKSQQSGYEVFGIRNQGRVVTDGVDHTEGVGGTGFYEDYFATEEVSVSALGADVEMNSPGAALATTVKSGGNSFKGLYNITYEDGSWVGKNTNANLISRGFTGNPNLLFYEGHVDLGGPIKKDKLWFYGAYNHFKIDKAVSGVSQSIATDLGIFDNYTVKSTWKASDKNTIIGMFQQGRKQKPKRGLSSLLPPESVRAQDSYSKMYKGEFQRVVSNRAFLSVNVGSFSLDWPMVVVPGAGDPRVFRSTGAVAGRGWNAFTTRRKKPQVKAQLTYYLPEAKGSHDFKFGFEDIYDSYKFGINGTSGPIRYSINAAGVADRIRFVDVGAEGDYEKGWVASPNIDQHYAGFLQDRWAPNNRMTISLGLRIDYQKIAYQDGVRKPLISDLLADGTRIFEPNTTVPGATLLTNTDFAPRIGFTYDLSGKGTTVLKGFYGRYYNNMADGFSSANPGGTNYAEYVFLDPNANGKYDGPAELGALRFRIGGASASVNADLKTPHADEISGTVEHQFWGESSARFTYVRKNVRNFVPYYYTPLVPAWINNINVPMTVTVDSAQFGHETFHVLDIPANLASESAQRFDNYPDGSFNYDTIEFAFNKRVGSKLFFETSYDYQWRNELRSPDSDNSTEYSTSPLFGDPIGPYPFLNVNPSAPNRQKTTNAHLQLLGRYTFPYDIGFAANMRWQNGFPFSRIIPDGFTNEGLNLAPNPFMVENMKNNRADNVTLLNFRVDKTFALGSRGKFTAMLDIYNVLNNNAVTNFNLLTNDFNRIIAVLDPRVAQIGFRFEF